MSETRMTTDEDLRTPETLLPQELAYGFVREAAAAPTPGHQWMVGEIFSTLRAHLELDRSGRVWMAPIDVVLDRERHLVLQPDVVYVAQDRLHIVTDRVWGAPDLVVEVLSPFPRMGRLEERLDWFAQYRCPGVLARAPTGTGDRGAGPLGRYRSGTCAPGAAGREYRQRSCPGSRRLSKRCWATPECLPAIVRAARWQSVQRGQGSTSSVIRRRIW